MRALCILAVCTGLASTSALAQSAVSDEQAAANTAKAIAEARKAQAEADLAAVKARVGVDVAAPYGSTTAGTGAGTIEAYMLAAGAVQSAAGVIVAKVKAARTGAIVLITNADTPTFNSLIGFSLSRKVFEDAYEDAKKALDKLTQTPPPPKPTGVPPAPGAAPLAAAALSLDALNKIMGFFRSDYTIAGMDITYEDSILLHAVASELVANKIETSLPIQYNRPALDSGGAPIFDALKSIAEKRADAQVRLPGLEKLHGDTDTAYKAETDPAKKKALGDYLAKVKEVWDKWKALPVLFDGQFGKLGIPDDKGNVPVALLIKESAINEALKTTGAQLLIVKMQKSGGSYFTKKNLWTSLGAMPFYVAGGTVASFVLFGGASGKVVEAGVVPIHGGYQRVDAIESAFKPPAPATPKP